MGTSPTFLILGGPNGAGKSTAASVLIPEETPFLNADELAKALPGYPSRDADIKASVRLIEQMKALVERSESFAVESTLAGRSLAQWANRLRGAGYMVEVSFLWTPSPDFSIRRVGERVRLGGHSIPEDVIRRRYHAGLANLFRLYIPAAEIWKVYDNTDFRGPRLVAAGKARTDLTVLDPVTWASISRGHLDDSSPE